MSRDIERFGTWVGALGTILEAIGSTPRLNLPEMNLEASEMIGIAMQAGGDALVANEADAVREKVGNSISSIGNVTMLYGVVRDVSEKRLLELYSKGDALQALGSMITLEQSYPPENKKGEALSFYGTIVEITM